MDLRIGNGLDIHPLVKGRPCILGGVQIPSEVGPEGHSDADVLLHALCDALLGALGESDIGSFFPNNDPQYKNKRSTFFVEKVMEKVRAQGYVVNNIDCSLIAEVPKILPFRKEIIASLARLLHIEEQRIGLKATTAEKLGALGRKEGIFASVVVLLKK